MNDSTAGNILIIRGFFLIIPRFNRRNWKPPRLLRSNFDCVLTNATQSHFKGDLARGHTSNVKNTNIFDLKTVNKGNLSLIIIPNLNLKPNFC